MHAADRWCWPTGPAAPRRRHGAIDTRRRVASGPRQEEASAPPPDEEPVDRGAAPAACSRRDNREVLSLSVLVHVVSASLSIIANEPAAATPSQMGQHPKAAILSLEI